MTRWAVTGGTGLVGRFIVEDLLARGEDVVVLGRTRPPESRFSRPVAFRPFDLGTAAPDLSGCEALVHCAFDHVPGRYRGGEGNDPEGFQRRNIDGSLHLFQAARTAGVSRAVFLSSRAVYGPYPAGSTLHEDMTPRPETLYGHAKRAVEEALVHLSTPEFATTSLRATGVYGPAAPDQRHKWSPLFAAHLRGEVQTARAGTEVHGADLATAVWICTQAKQPPALCNVSDILLDRRDLLAEVNRLCRRDLPLPPAAEAMSVNVMDCAQLRDLGWRPRGRAGVVSALPQMLAQI